jgi:hypothetical protein
MSLDTVLPIVAGLAILIFVSVRQMTWQPVRLGQLMRMPLIMVVIGVIITAETFSSGEVPHFGAVDAMIISAELVIAVLGGWLMGRCTQIATIDGRTLSRLRPAGLAAWIGFIAIRIGFAVIAHLLGAGVASGTETILFMVAIVKATQGLTVRERVAQHDASTAAADRVLSGL